MILETSAFMRGVYVIKIEPQYTSKACSKCGTIKENLTLKDRVFICDNCGYVEHRDVNASKNILYRGLKSFGLGTSLLDFKQEALRVS